MRRRVFTKQLPKFKWSEHYLSQYLLHVMCDRTYLPSSIAVQALLGTRSRNVLTHMLGGSAPYARLDESSPLLRACFGTVGVQPTSQCI